MSVRIIFGMPIYAKLWIIPMNRFSCLAFGKNSAYRIPQWWHTSAKQAHLHFCSVASSTSAKLQSIWNISPEAL